MIAEISIDGVYLPGPLVVGMLALLVMSLLAPLLQLLGAYRLVAHRPLVDLGLLVLVFSALAALASSVNPL